MRRSISKKILTYFFLLLVLGSINNYSLNDIKFYNVKRISIFGLDEISNASLHNKLSNLQLGNIFLIDKLDILKIINSNSSIENYKITKKYPSTLEITLKKTTFLAKLNQDGKEYLVGSNGKLIQKEFIDKNLAYIFGDIETQEFLKLKKIIEQSKISFNQIKKFYFFPSKRWDLELDNKIIIKLPQINIIDSLDNAFKILKNKKFENVKIIDLRINNQIILND